jgi:hypothetical protein
MLLLFTLLILGGSVFLMFRFSCKGDPPVSGDTGIASPDLGIEPPFDRDSNDTGFLFPRTEP